MLDLKIIYPDQLQESCFVDDVYYNSKLVKPNGVFVAIKGEKVDGHDYVKMAFDHGAVAAIVEVFNPNISGCQIVVEDTHFALAEISHKLNPLANPLTSIGVTGTDGKTSATVIIQALLNKLGNKVGYIGTNGIEYSDVKLNLNCTTPMAKELFAILADMSRNDVDIVSMEVSSHALANQRVATLAYDYTVFTNFSRDHLDFHKTIAEYKAAKLKLFTQLSKTGKAIINIDDAVACDFIEATKGHVVLTYGLKNQEADFFADDIEYLPEGMSFLLHHKGKSIRIKTKLLGEFNIYNILVAIAIASDLNYALEDIAAKIAEIETIPGRMELFYHKKRSFTAIVDFGHAPNAIKNVLKVCRKLTKGKLVVVTGAVGDGDRRKRPLMAENATKYADFAIFTTDQPYSEDPLDIINEMLETLTAENYQVILDREGAINTALNQASSGDVIVIMGKGRETKIKYKNHEIDFSDYEYVKKYMKVEVEE